MPYYKVTKVMQYTEEVYVEAESIQEANHMSGSFDGIRNEDDHWYDSEAVEVSQEEYEDNA